MVQETDKIKDRIQTERGKLEHDLHEFERRVTNAMDWKEWFKRNPVRMMGAAAVGGFVLSLVMPRPSGADHIDRYAELERRMNMEPARQSLLSRRKTSAQFDRVAGVFDNTVAALLGVASRKVRDFIGGVVPNFEDEYHEVEANRRQSQYMRTEK